MVLLKESDRIKMSYKKVGAFKKWQKCFRGDENERICIRIKIDKGHRRCPKQRILSNVILKNLFGKKRMRYAFQFVTNFQLNSV